MIYFNLPVFHLWTWFTGVILLKVPSEESTYTWIELNIAMVKLFTKNAICLNLFTESDGNIKNNISKKIVPHFFLTCDLKELDLRFVGNLLTN